MEAWAILVSALPEDRPTDARKNAVIKEHPISRGRFNVLFIDFWLSALCFEVGVSGRGKLLEAPKAQRAAPNQLAEWA